MISSLYAAGAPAPQGGGIMGLLPLILIFAVFYFLVMLPQKKQRNKHKAFLESLSTGMDVITSSGLIGKVTNVGERFVTLEVSDGVKVKVIKSYIAGDAKELLVNTK